MEEKDIKKPLSRKEIMDRIPAYMSLMIIAPIIGNFQYILQDILQFITSKVLGLSPNNAVEETQTVTWLDKILPVALHIIAGLLMLSAVIHLAYYLFLLTKDSALVEVPESEEVVEEMETVETPKKKMITGYRYVCEYCGSEYILDSKFRGAVPKCKSCGATLKRKLSNEELENLLDEGKSFREINKIMKDEES